MPCDTQLKVGQTLTQRADELRKRMVTIDAMLTASQIKVKVGPQGAITFTQPNGKPLANEVRDGLTDACIYRRIMASGSSQARMAITRAGAVNPAAVRQGIHSHDGGSTWHPRG